MNIPCPHCTQPLELDEQWAGQQVDCPLCRQALIVPVSEADGAATRTNSRSARKRPLPTQAKFPASAPLGSASGNRRVPVGRVPAGGGGGGSGKWLLLIALLLAAGAMAWACFHYQESPTQVWQRLTTAVRDATHPPAPTPVPTPTATPTATPTLATEPGPTPPPPPTPVPSPTLPPATPAPDPLAWLLEHRERWPREIVLTDAVVFPILSDGRKAGEGTVSVGTSVLLLQIEPATASVMVAYAGYGNSTQRLSIQQTDLRQRAAAAMSKAEASARTTFAAPATTGPSAPPDDENSRSNRSPAPAIQASALTDDVTFGDERSEQKHGLQAEKSEVARAALDQSSRRLLPGGGEPWEGGKVSFTMKVDPKSPTYFTVRFWGDEANRNRLILYCEGKQIGYRHLGDVDMLDIGETEEPPYNGRFYYVTMPLPLKMTQGKSELHFQIRAVGRIFAYGTTFDKFQLPMDDPSRGMYRAYTHVDPCFVPPTGEKQGTEPPAPVRSEPGMEVLGEMKQHLVRTIDNLLTASRPLNQTEALLLARAYHLKWSPAFHNAKALELVVKSVDKLYADWKKDEKLMLDDPATQNPGWFGAGPAAEAVDLLVKVLGPSLDAKLAGDKTRRSRWLDLFIESRDWLRHHRRLYTNQSMIVDLNIYRSHRAVAVLDPKRAIPEETAKRYLYEALGLQPWLGSDTDHGPEKPMGDDYFQTTEKGLTKELGYVGNYGEVLDWLAQIYDATRPEPGQPGDEKILAQITKIVHARAAFRYPMLDEDGKRAMRVETVVGWRDHHYPGPVTYAQIGRRDGGPFDTAALTLDPRAVGYAQQMLADNQFFAGLRDMLKKRGLFESQGMLDTIGNYEIIKAQKPSSYKLPMSGGQPDFVFSDEEDGVVALKNGGDILYVSLYWRANRAVNFLARIHYLTPTADHIAVVREEVKFAASGTNWERPDDIQILGAPWIPRYPVNTGSAEAGEELPVAQIPHGVAFKPGQESIYAGKGEFYALRYGPYLIGMNLTRNKDFELPVPSSLRTARELVSGKTISLNGNVKVGPKATVVLYTGNALERPGNPFSSR